MYYKRSEKETFTLNLVSREAITNETVRVGKRFPSSQKISDSVKNIVEKYLSSNKLYDIDETQNPYGFIGNMKKPFTILTWLASKSVPHLLQIKTQQQVIFSLRLKKDSDINLLTS